MRRKKFLNTEIHSTVNILDTANPHAVQHRLLCSTVKNEFPFTHTQLHMQTDNLCGDKEAKNGSEIPPLSVLSPDVQCEAADATASGHPVQAAV